MRYVAAVALCLCWSQSLLAYDVTTAASRRLNLLEYIETRDDLDAGQKGAWDRAVRLVFGGKALKDGTDEGVTVAKSVISAAIFFDVPPATGAEAAYEAYHDTYRWVPPPIAINYQLLAFQGRKPAESARRLAAEFPRYFNEELAVDLVVWWDAMLGQGKIPALEVDAVKKTLAETRALMRPMMLERLWQAVQLEARGNGKALDEVGADLRRGFKGVGNSPAIHRGAYYGRYRALARELGVSPRPQPARVAPRSRQARVTEPPAPPASDSVDGSAEQKKVAAEEQRQRRPDRIPAPLPGEPLVPIYGGWQEQLERVIESWLGAPYRFGGLTRSGVDCSGFSRAVFRQAFNIELPRSSRAQFRTGRKVEQAELRRGDLVFFDTLDRGRVTHVGVFAGEGMLAHASTRGVVRSRLSRRYYQRAYWGSRRLLKRSSP